MNKQNKIKKYLVVVIVLLVCICVTLPIVFNQNFLEYFPSLLMASCSVVTLIVAIILFDKYGVEHTIKDKNFRAVNDLMEDLQKMNISVRVINNESSKNQCVCYLLNIDFQSNYKNRLEGLSADYLSSQLFFTIISINELSKILSKGSRNLYMPPSIVEKIKLVSFSSFVPIDEEKMPKMLYCVFDTQFNEEPQKLYTPEELTTLYVYFENLDGLKKSCVQWLLENGGDGSINDTPFYY